MTYRIRNVTIAVGLAFVAALLTLFYVTNYRRSVQQGQATVPVYVAAHNIPAGTAGADLVHGHAFRVESIARRNVVQGAISDPTQVSTLVVSQPIYAGEQVTVRRFTDVKAEGIVGQLKATMRAVQVAGDANQLLVDLVANLRVDPNTDAHETRIVLRDLTVLADPTTSATPSSGQPASVMLAITDTQVQRLFYVLKNADWTLELRPAIDSLDSPERIETLNSVLTGGIR
jgi:Flp pilus assembly protein CpaB